MCNAGCAAAVAAGLPVGTIGDTGGNTLGCRQYHSDTAAGNAANTAAETDAHCGHGNLVGGSTASAFVCASAEEAYCALQMANCPGYAATDNSGDNFADYAACWTALTAASLTAGTIGDTSGDTLACRLYHLEVSAGAPTGGHCGHGAITSTGQCL